MGHSVQILERCPISYLEPRGAGIVSGPSIDAFFSLFNSSPTPCINLTQRLYLDRLGHVIESIDRTQRTTSWGVLYATLRQLYDQPSCQCQDEICRQTARGERAAYCFGCEATSVIPLGNGAMAVEFITAQGRTETVLADLVIGADGFNSALRAGLLPEVQPAYAGYVAWRGVIPEMQLSHSIRGAYVGKMVFYQGEATQFVAYTMPGEGGSSQPGERRLNWVWYQNCGEGSDEHNATMTDTHGTLHRVTVAPGLLNRDVWDERVAISARCLPPPLGEIVKQTADPFVQKIIDVASHQATFYGGRVLLVGDAMAAPRPHTGSSTDQSAFQALKLLEVLRGKIDVTEWERKVLQHATDLLQVGVKIGADCGLGGSGLSPHPVNRLI
ncbi:hypothetical protein RRF57_013186 [Xylaria bambusicola]|uniref:2,6-dihydroxypyridine 3-monooxygenase substrate binding domain-containing protein n=1 Tax=Xylaria bambusicola TaxID=326684 RepID=A0AAN7V2J3_9PEZI